MPDTDQAAPAPPPGGVLLDSKEIMDAAARDDGIICAICGGVIDGVGYEFISLKPVMEGADAVVRRARIILCDRDGCADARGKARRGATACRSIAGGWEIPQREEKTEEPSGE